MTAQSLKIDLNKLGTYFRYKIGTLKTCIIVQFILGLLSYPLTFALSIVCNNASNECEAAWRAYLALNIEDHGSPEYIHWQELNNNLNALESIYMFVLIIGLCSLLGIALMHFMTALKCFRWLYKKELVDMDYALPISSDTRFLGDSLAGLAAAGIPHFIIAAASSVFFYLYKWVDVDGQVFEEIRFLAEIPWTGLAACLLFYCFNLLLMSLFGKHGQMVVIPVIVNFVLTAVEMFGALIFFLCAYGYNDIMEGSILINFIAPYSPIGLVGGEVLRMNALFNYGAPTLPYILTPRIIIPVLLISVLCYFAAWYIIRNRRSESVGKAYISPIARHIVNGFITAGIAVCFGCLLISYIGQGEKSAIPGVVIWTIAATFAAYFSLELTSVGLKKIWFTFMRYVGFVALGAVVVVGIACCDGFGTGKKAPNPDLVGQVDVEFTSSISGGANSYTDNWYYSEDSIRTVAEMHNELPKRRLYSSVYEGLVNQQLGDTRNYLNSGYHSLRLVYHMKDGTTSSYIYPITDEEKRDILRKTTCAESLMSRDYDWHLDLDYEWEPEGYALGMAYELHEEDFTAITGDINLDELREAIKKDCENVTYERMYTCISGEYTTPLTFKVKITSSWSEPHSSLVTLNVYPWFDNTIAYLRENGIEMEFSPTADANTAMLLKIDGYKTLGKDSYDFREQYTYGIEPLINLTIGECFGLAGDESYFEYVKNFDIYTDDEMPETAQQAIDDLRKNSIRSVKFVPLDSEELRELIAMGGSEYDINQSSANDSYVLILTDVTSEDVRSGDFNELPKMERIVYFPVDKLSRAAEIFAGLPD